MKTFKKYLLINIFLIVFHFMMYFTAAMGFGSGSPNPPQIVVFEAILTLSIVGASPNLFIFLYSAIRKKKIVENALWALVFSLIVMIGYFTVFWELLNLS
ncbi:hypothetical protein [Paenisporosarcina antarctica]|uniref:Uncharacterized protein n=1 Tax=Paenisporosarcina antarctica TaxID=417367 RepID=A0A4P6ZUN2_9BACL|nr:hypothetical protein [Paenisporosarcina antarctica]QBP40190.1 hypothetical protein E2636_03050 [Paenisporosarcina antarctica]